MKKSDIIEYIVALVNEFALRNNITDTQAVKYLADYGAISLCEKHYDFLHTQPFASNVSDLMTYCRRNGGKL